MTKVTYIWASWCQPCSRVKPVMAELESLGVSVTKIDADVQSDYLRSIGVSSLPTVIVKHADGSEVRLIGAKSRDEYMKAVGL
jgi:thioredoxin-like negative regulator of GroEL